MERLIIGLLTECGRDGQGEQRGARSQDGQGSRAAPAANAIRRMVWMDPRKEPVWAH